MSEFRFNVSQLLQEPTGATRQYTLDDAQLDLDQSLTMRPVVGDVRLTRTPDGVLADVEVQGKVELECGRCLTLYEQPVALEFSEEFYQTVNVHTGARLPLPEGDDDIFLIDETHKLDLAEPMREYTLLELPPAPRCREDCKGLSISGRNLNEEPDDTPPEPMDERLAVLEQLLQQPDQDETR
jgi:uncharacterized protein